MNNALVICPAFCNQSETFIYAMQEKLKDFQVSVLCYDRRNPEIFSFPEERIHTLRGKPLQELLITLGWNCAKIEEPRVIHAQYALSAKLAYGLKKYFGNRPQVVLHIHGQDFYVPLKQRKLGYLRQALLPADLILTPSNYVKQRIQAVFPEKQAIEAYYTAINAVDFPFQGPASLSKDVFLFMIGRLVQKKGYLTALKALQKVINADQEHNYHLRIVGQGPLAEEIDRLIKALHLEKNVTVGPIKENAAVRQAFLASHIFWAPSETAANGDEEGLPRTVTEALALGIPIIATRHAGIPEAVIDSETGLLCDEKDWQGLATKTLWAIKNWSNMLKYAEQGRRHFEHYFGGQRLNKLADKYTTPLKEFLHDLET